MQEETGVNEVGGIISALQAARAKGHVAELKAEDLPEALETAYGLAASQLQEVAAWKIGGANPWSQQVFGNAEVFFGPLAPGEVYLDTAELSLNGLCAPLAEPEIMLEIADPDSDGFARMGLGFEIPASVLPEAAKTRLTGQICDRAGAGALWIGAVRDFDASALETPFTSTFTHNGGAPITGRSTNVKGGPLGAAREFLMLARRYGLPVLPGQWIATGGLNPAVAVTPGDQVGFAALGDQVSVAFT